MLDEAKVYSSLSIHALPGGGFLVTHHRQDGFDNRQLAAFSVIEGALEFIETHLDTQPCL